jgi:hypothetical protein
VCLSRTLDADVSTSAVATHLAEPTTKDQIP